MRPNTNETTLSKGISGKDEQRGRSSRSRRKDHPPSRSVSPSNQSAGILFRLAPDSGIESVCVGGYVGGSGGSGNGCGINGNGVGANGPSIPSIMGGDQHNSMKFLLESSSTDYGFSMAARERSRHAHQQPTTEGIYSPTIPDSPEASRFTHEDEDYTNLLNRTAASLTKSINDHSLGGTARSGGRKRAIGTASATGNNGSSGGSSGGGGGRCCISCGATKTPYWREAWSTAVLLCNACGLRYSKFRRRCLDCCYVPRKEDKGSRICTKCGGPWS